MSQARIGRIPGMMLAAMMGGLGVSGILGDDDVTSKLPRAGQNIVRQFTIDVRAASKNYDMDVKELAAKRDGMIDAARAKAAEQLKALQEQAAR